METPDELQTGWSLSINRAWVTLQCDTHTHAQAPHLATVITPITSPLLTTKPQETDTRYDTSTKPAVQFGT